MVYLMLCTFGLVWGFVIPAVICVMVEEILDEIT